MTATAEAPGGYADRLLAELGDIETAFHSILDDSAIMNTDPNRGADRGLIFVGYASWGWAKSGAELEAARMQLLGRVRDWGPRFRLLFPHPTPQVSKALDRSLALLEGWLVRRGGDHSVPATVAAAKDKLAKKVEKLRELRDLLPIDEHPVRLIVDTNVLIDYPDLGLYRPQLGAKYRTHLLPVVLREIDDLKRSGRTQELRDWAKRADRYLKELRRRGDVRAGVKVVDAVTAVFEHVEPRSDGLPSWLDLDVPDDRFVASALLLQSRHPGSVVHIATSDLNMQNKLGAVGLPYVEPSDGETLSA